MQDRSNEILVRVVQRGAKALLMFAGAVLALFFALIFLMLAWALCAGGKS